jgi:protein NrfC
MGVVLVGTGVRESFAGFRGETVLAVPASRGYLLVDPKKCQGCANCMVSCSLVHHGSVNLSLARIQTVFDPLGRFPDDAAVAQCRQCVEPACLEVCPSGALHVDGDHGNVRTVNQEECIGCMRCIEACSHLPARSIWNHEIEVAQKCDLCANAPFWHQEGGPAGRKACVEICPMHAIAFTEEIPVQTEDAGYLVNLRGAAWRQFGYTTD